MCRDCRCKLPQITMFKSKILMLGPCQSGKTVIANFLSDATETSGGEYHPTQGCRILEFEANGIQVGKKMVTAEIELWDVSGDQKFEACWPAIAKDAGGVVFVFNPDQANYDKELETWFRYFVEHQGLRDVQCCVFAHFREPDQMSQPTLPSSMSKINCVNTSLDNDGATLREEFNNYLSDMLTALSDKHEQEELSIIRS